MNFYYIERGQGSNLTISFELFGIISFFFLLEILNFLKNDLIYAEATNKFWIIRHNKLSFLENSTKFKII
jgi:hypothetical protein